MMVFKMFRNITPLFLLLCQVQNLNAQGKLQVIAEKNYRLLSLLQNDPATAKLIVNDSILAQVTHTKIAAIRSAISICKDTRCVTESLKFSDQEIKTVGGRLSALYQDGNALGKLVEQKLVTSGAYSLYNGLDRNELLLKAWKQDAEGINHAIAVYAEGIKPNYPDIDSISFNVHQKGYEQFAVYAASMVLQEAENSNLFFSSSMDAALLFLDLNERYDAATYEPMNIAINKLALQKSKEIQWNNYSYTLILIPGEDRKSTRLNSSHLRRSRMPSSA